MNSKGEEGVLKGAEVTMSSGLTEEQKRRIEENRRKALALRQKKQQCSPQKSLISTVKPAPYTTPTVVSQPKLQQSTQKSLVNSTKCTQPTIVNKPRALLNANNLVSRPLNDKIISKPSIVSGTSSGSVIHSTSSTKPSPSAYTNTALNSLHSNSDVKNFPSTSSVPVLSKAENIDLERIKQNRLKALERRKEKLQQKTEKDVRLSDTKFNQTSATNSVHSSVFPAKQNNTTLSTNQTVQSNHGNRMLNSSPIKSVQMSKSNFSENQAQPMISHGQSNTAGVGQNIFTGFGGTPVKGGCFLISRDRFTVKAGYSEPLIQLFKLMDTKLYDAVTRKWSFKLSEYNKFMSGVVNLKSAVEIEPLPQAILKTFSSQLKGGNTKGGHSQKTIPMADLSNVEPSLVNSLMSFQREGVNFGIQQNGRLLLADDMGLGKTIQAICLACYYKSAWPLLVVVPSSVRFDWAQNFQRWVPSLDPQCINTVVSGKDSCTSGLINILSYDLMARKGNELKVKRFQTIIMDECHFLKNYKTARCKAALPLLQSAKHVILLSGTPALSRPLELFTQINAVCPYLFKYHEFGMRYCDGKQMPWGSDFSGSSNMEELQILLEENIMIRRLKKDVLTELPEKIRQMIMLDPSLIKSSKELKTACKVMTSGNLKKMEERGALLDFFHKSGSAKMKAIKSYVDDLLEGDKKFLIFAHHGDVLDEIEDSVKNKISDNYIRIDGKVPSEQRNFLCKKFQHNDNVKVAVLSITAANAGLNLSSASLVVFAELFWNPGILTQAEDRAHRIGQQDMVCVQYLVATGTSDDHIWPMIQKKLDVLGKAGLTKDNFSSAQTTRLKDSRQEEIEKFLEESFTEDMMIEEYDEFDTPRKKALRQESILKFTSPDCPGPSSESQQPAVQTKTTTQKKLFSYFSPTKQTKNSNSVNNTTGSQGQEMKGHGQPDEGHCEGQGDIDDDLDEFLKQCDDFLNEEMEKCDDEPVIKKRKV